jgi:hypothetical protein
MAQTVECLLYNHEALISNPRDLPLKKDEDLLPLHLKTKKGESK